MDKKTIVKIFETLGRAFDSRVGVAIDAAKAIKDAKTDGDRAEAIVTELDADLGLAGDYSGKAAIADPALAALLKKYVADGFALHAYIEAHKAQQAPAAPSVVPNTPGD